MDSGDLNDDRTHNVVNELTARDTDDNGSNNYTLSYNARGDMTSDGDDYTYKYDAFGRLKAVYAISGASLVAEYKYNGLGFRIGWHYDADADGTVENTTDDPWYLFVHDERWRIVNTYRLADWSYSVSNPTAANSKERFVYHNAGLGGWGGSSYIDAVILRDRDMNTAWTAASDGTLEKRHYYCQNWRADVSAIVTDTGKMVEWVKYSAYGIPFSLPAGDTDSDLDWDATDCAAMAGPYDVRKDADLDGDVDSADATHANSIKPGTGYQTLGRGILTSTGVDNRKSYAGYEYDPTYKGAGRVLMHVRHRVYDAELGRWIKRDPLGMEDDKSLQAYAQSDPVGRADIMGTASGQVGSPGQGGSQYGESCAYVCYRYQREPPSMARFDNDETWSEGCSKCTDLISMHRALILGAIVDKSKLACTPPDVGCPNPEMCSCSNDWFLILTFVCQRRDRWCVNVQQVHPDFAHAKCRCTICVTVYYFTSIASYNAPCYYNPDV